MLDGALDGSCEYEVALFVTPGSSLTPHQC